jgi:hypothetical protein
VSPPPLLAELILAELAGDRDTRDAVLGDLAEEYHSRCAEAGPSAAARWYWAAALASAPPLAGTALRRAGLAAWARGIAAVLAGLAALIGLFLVADIGVRRLIEAAGMARDEGGAMVVSLAVGAACAVAAGWVAAAVGRRAPFASAASLGTVFLILNVTALARGAAQGPRWYWLAFGLTACSGAVAGGLLRLRQEARSGGTR